MITIMRRIIIEIIIRTVKIIIIINNNYNNYNYNYNYNYVIIS